MKTKRMQGLAALASAMLFTKLVLAAPADAPASEASIRQLIAVTEARKLTDNISEQLDAAIRASMQQALAGKPVSAEQQGVLDEMRTQMIRLVSESLQWDQLESMFIEIYQKTFTQREVEGMLSFYQTEAGRALIAKMPLVMQSSMEAVQSQTAKLMPKLQQLQGETLEKLEAVKSQ